LVGLKIFKQICKLFGCVALDRTFGVLWFCILFAGAIGVANGDTDQSVYLLNGFRLADSTFITKDWYTWDTEHHHFFYSLFISVLVKLDIIESGLAVAAVLQSTCFAIGLYFITKTLYENPILPWATALLLFAAIKTIILGSAFLQPQFLASCISSVLVLAGIALIGMNFTVLAGVSFGLATIFHLHFAVLILPIVILICFYEAKLGNLRRLRMFLLPFLALGLYPLYQVASHAYNGISGNTFDIWLGRLPHHIAPDTWGNKPYLMFVGALLFGSSGLLIYRPRPNIRLFVIITGIGFIVITSLIIGHLRLIPAINMIWPWRLSHIVILFCFISGAAGLCFIQNGNRVLTNNWSAIAISCLLLGTSLITSHIRMVTDNNVALAALACWSLPAVVAVSERFKAYKRVPTVLLAAIPYIFLTIGFIPVTVNGWKASHFKLEDDNLELQTMYNWIKNNTPVDSLFVIPPGLSGFRLYARRAVVVDWKGFPYDKREQIEWLKRIRTVTGLERYPSLKDLCRGYANMDENRINALKKRYKADYVIIPKEIVLKNCKILYDGKYYKVGVV
jgi:hypothetical protein